MTLSSGKIGDQDISLDRNLVEKKAYEIWEAEGRPSDRAAIHWSLAEQALAESLAQSADLDAAEDDPTKLADRPVPQQRPSDRKRRIPGPA